MANQIERRACVSGLMATWLAAAPARAAQPAGAVETSRGDCFALSAATRRSLATGANVFVGDSVGTGAQSALGLRLGQATEVKLGAEASLRIDRFLVNAGGLLLLDRGPLLYTHDAADTAEITVRSPFGLMAVRGTRFFAGPSNGVFGVFVERGAVMVIGRNTAVLVSDGEGTNIAHPGDEPTAPAPWGAARIAAAMASVQ